jgi:hypothetical protein
MTNDDRSLERAARSWLEEGPTHAPDRAVDAALSRIQSIPQERQLRLPWRFPPMFTNRLTVAAAAVVLVVVGAGLALSRLTSTTPGTTPAPTSTLDPSLAVCPQTVNEADATDTAVAGLSSDARAWRTVQGVPDHVGSGWIAGFTSGLPEGNPATVVLLDPGSGRHCDLVRLASNHPINDTTALAWSPSGDALAIGLGGEELADGPADGVVLLWTKDRLLRLWTGAGSPRLEFAPNGTGLLMWSSDGSMGVDGRPSAFDTRLITADGAPDRSFDFSPWLDGLHWSPDGDRWLVVTAIEAGTVPAASVSIVNVADGRSTPLDVGAQRVTPIGWVDDETILLRGDYREPGPAVFIEVPIADPSLRRELAGPENQLTGHPVLSPDRTRLLYPYGEHWSDRSDLRILGTDALGQVPLRLAPDVTAGGAGFAWSPDGRQVIFPAVEGGWWIVNVDGSDLHQVGSDKISLDSFSTADAPWQAVPVR